MSVPQNCGTQRLKLGTNHLQLEHTYYNHFCYNFDRDLGMSCLQNILVEYKNHFCYNFDRALGMNCLQNLHAYQNNFCYNFDREFGMSCLQKIHTYSNIHICYNFDRELGMSCLQHIHTCCNRNQQVLASRRLAENNLNGIHIMSITEYFDQVSRK